MRRRAILAAALVAGSCAPIAAAQEKWAIVDNSFLVEESFNQERGIFQNIFTWTRTGSGSWEGSFTQEWPVPGVRHQLSYTIPFSRIGTAAGLNDALVNYRYQLLEEGPGRPAVSPRLSLVLPTGREADGLGDGALGLQFNVPASKQFGDLYVHLNAGMTWLPDAGRRPFVAASGIWRATPLLNLMLETVTDVDDALTVSPGVRRGWNFGDRQLVGGVALPITRSGRANRVALLTYLSYELPFR